ncbi:hypothetical protein RF55_18699 [Lasius niger]|uniref:Uncharacterized protein n=1 Tax=Lasius niger TaxID=67767 RepID=A0A0J7MTY7_LASNI|nr:hypothetical protein RF55_18699 [Lasius niger]
MDWSSIPQSPQSAKKSISTDTDNNGNVIETTKLESIQLESIAFDAITSSSDQRISKVIAIGFENAPKVPISLSGFDIPTVSHQEFSNAVAAGNCIVEHGLKTEGSTDGPGAAGGCEYEPKAGDGVLITIIPQEEKSSQMTKLRRTTMTIEKILESIVELEDYIKSGVEEGASHRDDMEASQQCAEHEEAQRSGV